MIHVIAIITAVEGARADLLKEIRGNRSAVLEEPGCIEYSVAVDAAAPAPMWSSFGPDAIVIIEKWQDRAALKAHAVAPHMVAYAARVKNLMASRAIHVLEPAL